MAKTKEIKPKNKLITGLAIVIVVATVCGFFLMQKGDRVDKTVRSGEVVIEMRQDDYLPDEIYITKGTVVKFVNSNDGARWPASDLHPSHGIYPAFDPKRPIPSGGDWSFRFEDIGVWTMHDHLAPYITGLITVLE